MNFGLKNEKIYICLVIGHIMLLEELFVCFAKNLCCYKYIGILAMIFVQLRSLLNKVWCYTKK